MSETETSMIEMYVKGKSLKQVAAAHGVSDMMIRDVLKRNKVPRRPRGGANFKPKPIDEAKVLRLYQEGAAVKVIAKDLGVDHNRVRKIIVDAGLTRHYAALNETLAAEIKTLRQRHKWPWSKLEHRTGVSRSALRNVVEGRSWKHVQPADFVPGVDDVCSESTGA
jgi:lambda repressor-like predicted transcriptional regulator